MQKALNRHVQALTLVLTLVYLAWNWQRQNNRTNRGNRETLDDKNSVESPMDVAQHRNSVLARECNVCGQHFGTKQARDQHRKAKHTQITTCERCDKEFKTEEGRDRHYQDVHVDRECGICGKRFQTKAARDQHRDAKHIYFNCDDCGREFISKQSLHQHRQAKHANKNKNKKKSLAKKPTAPPIPDLKGEWVRPSDFRGTKSFGFFICWKCANAPAWYSAHAFPRFKQGCKVCNIETFPQFLWQNAQRSNREEVGDSEKLNGPHQSDRCEACRSGMCVRSLPKGY